jgi:hypothetical protein
MAIPAVNVTYFQQGPTASGQVLADVTSSISDLNLNFFATVVLDGTLTTFTLNWIDGTQTLSFVPRAVKLDITGGTQAAATVQAINCSAMTNVGCTANVSAAGTNANTLTIVGTIYR